MWLAGSARHEEDFIQAKIREQKQLKSLEDLSDVYVYNKRIWDIKPWDYPSGDTFRAFLGVGSVPPQVVEPDSEYYDSEYVVDVPVELETAFKAQPINAALRDICGIPSKEVGNFIVEVERAKGYFKGRNIFLADTCTFMGQDSPQLSTEVLKNYRVDRPWFCHLDLSRTSDSTGLAVGYVDGWINNRPQIQVAGVLEIPPVQGYVVPWDRIVAFLFRLSADIPLRAISADQVGYHYLAEQVTQYGYSIAKVSDNPRSEIYHHFLSALMEGDITIARHDKTISELLALNVDEKTGKVEKPAGGSKDCADALVGLVTLIKLLPTFQHDLRQWIKPKPPELVHGNDGAYQVVESHDRKLGSKITLI
jgi:hypothetical protein